MGPSNAYLKSPGPLSLFEACQHNRPEPPCTDPYARWSGAGWRVTAAPMPISRKLRGGRKSHIIGSMPTNELVALVLAVSVIAACFIYYRYWAVPRLIKRLLGSSNSSVRLECVAKLAEHRQPAVLKALLRAGQDPEADVRMAAVRVLAAWAKSGLDALDAALEDVNREVRHAAVKALLRAGQDPQADVRMAAACALAAWGESGRDALDAALKDVRQTAVGALLRAGQDPEADVRMAVVRALAAWGESGLDARMLR